jgi:hypothetical protein
LVGAELYILVRIEDPGISAHTPAESDHGSALISKYDLTAVTYAIVSLSLYYRLRR